MNIEKCKLLGMDNEDIYFKLSNEYKKYFEKFILSNVNLKKYDNEIKSSELGFGELSKKIVLKSKLDEFMDINHIFVLNSFYIEKLDNNQIEILKNGTNEDKEKLIKATYKAVIRDNYYNGKYRNEVYKVNYLNSTSNYGYFDNDSLVLAIYYGSNKYEYGSKENYLINYEEKRKYLDNMCNEIKTNIKNELGIKCDIIYSKI